MNIYPKIDVTINHNIDYCYTVIYVSDIRWRFIGKSENPLDIWGAHTCSVGRNTLIMIQYIPQEPTQINLWIQQLH